MHAIVLATRRRMSLAGNLGDSLVDNRNEGSFASSNSFDTADRYNRNRPPRPGLAAIESNQETTRLLSEVEETQGAIRFDDAVNNRRARPPGYGTNASAYTNSHSQRSTRSRNVNSISGAVHHSSLDIPWPSSNPTMTSEDGLENSVDTTGIEDEQRLMQDMSSNISQTFPDLLPRYSHSDSLTSDSDTDSSDSEPPPLLNGETLPQPSQLQNEETPNENGSTSDNTSDPSESVQSLTNRLRCLFTLLTLPILPLGSVLALLLCNLVYAGFLVDVTHHCAHPLKSFTLISISLFLYAPYHKKVKLYLFQYSRDRDGPMRPRSVRIYDQCFHLLCLIYVYSGMVLMQSCKEDLVFYTLDNNVAISAVGDVSAAELEMTNVKTNLDSAVNFTGANENGTGTDHSGGHELQISTCLATCPALYAATQRFVLTLQVFTLVLLMPLVCLPCVYLWILRRVNSVEAWEEHLRREREHMEGEDRATSKEIMEELIEVRLVLTGARATGSSNEGIADANKVKVVVVKPGGSSKRHIGGENERKSEDEDTAVVCSSEEDERATNTSITAIDKPKKAEKIFDWEIVKDCCICMSEFNVSSEKKENIVSTEQDEASSTTVPLLVDDYFDLESGLAAEEKVNNESRDIQQEVEDEIIVQTKCGHLFHKSCIGRWIGDTRDSRGIRAIRSCCPLCREDLSPTS